MSKHIVAARLCRDILDDLVQVGSNIDGKLPTGLVAATNKTIQLKALLENDDPQTAAQVTAIMQRYENVQRQARKTGVGDTDALEQRAEEEAIAAGLDIMEIAGQEDGERITDAVIGGNKYYGKRRQATPRRRD